MTTTNVAYVLAGDGVSRVISDVPKGGVEQVISKIQQNARASGNRSGITWKCFDSFWDAMSAKL